MKRPFSFALFSLRLLSGIIGGVCGTLALFIVYFSLQNLVPQTEEATSLSLFVVIIMTFVGTLVANTLTGVMVTFMDNQKYNRRKTIIMHIFLFNLILFICTTPLYLLGSGLNIINGIAALHFLLSAFVSALLMEALAGYEYSLTGIYGTSLGMFLSIAIALLIMAAGVKPITIMFMAMPGVWLILQIVGGLTELVYENFVRLYGIEALDVHTDLGGDTEEEQEEEDESKDVDDSL